MKPVQKRLEIEAKFLLRDPAKQIPKLLKFLRKEQMKISEPVCQTHTDRYFDTLDWDLHQAGWSYRFRDAGPRNRSIDLKALSVSASGDGIHQRREVELPVEDFPESGALMVEASLAQELEGPPSNWEAPLRELFRGCTDRASYKLTNDKAEIMLCVDDTRVETDRDQESSPLMHYCELEFELQSGKEKNLRRLAERVAEKFDLVPARFSKFERGLQAAGVLPSSRKQPARVESIGPNTPVVQLARHFLEQQLLAMLANEGKAIEGLHPEGVHQMRVASRRLRVGLCVFRDYLPVNASKELLEEVKWITNMLGEVRDLDVFRETVARNAAAAQLQLPEYRAYLAASWETARRELIKSLTSGRFQQFKRKFSAFLEHEFWIEEAKHTRDVRALKLAGNMLLPAITQFSDTGTDINSASPAKRLHQLRLHGKRLRYRLELFAPVVPGGLKSFVKPSKELQKYLGEFQDACVALKRIENFRTSRELNNDEKKDLEKLRDIVRRKKRTLRKAYLNHWSEFVARARQKRLRKLIETIDW